jgi:tRNA A-37 threonylcarbamoyl transferase component Bud32
VTPDPLLVEFLWHHGLASREAPMRWTPLAGGVSSDIWLVSLPDRQLCVKRALPKLKVAADWQAPVRRNSFEWEWLRFAWTHCADVAPQPLAHDAGLGIFAMSFLPADRYSVWKSQLLNGVIERSTARAVGQRLARLHAASAGNADIAQRFESTEIFRAIRLEPYLLETAHRHGDLAPLLRSLAERTAATRMALVHGDVSPKNILVGPHGPVFLDAECAWYGDPAFDLAFCLNHLLLKAIVRRADARRLISCFDTLAAAYRSEIDWEPPHALESRAASLLPALLLARVDGKSPVEYLTREQDKTVVRTVARTLLREPVYELEAVAARLR